MKSSIRTKVQTPIELDIPLLVKNNSYLLMIIIIKPWDRMGARDGVN
jgi:hypothetical protein